MAIRDKYWAMYGRIKLSERYYFYYRQRSERWNRLILIILAAASLSSVANLTLWRSVPFVWALIAMAAQILSAIAYLLPFSDQVKALNFVMPELDQMLNRIDRDWDRIVLNALTDAEINDLVYQYDSEFSALEHKYMDGINFPVRRRLHAKAEAERDQYFKTRFITDEKEMAYHADK